MKNKKTIRRFVYAFFFLLAVLNISTIFVWKLLYFNPKDALLKEQENMIYEKFYDKKYDSYEELVLELDKIDEISYSIESEKHHIDKNVKDNNAHSNIFSELIEINNQNYLLKIYSNDAFDISSLAIGFLKAHGIVAIAIAILSVFVINRTLINPLRKLGSDMQDYKFGKKPQKTTYIHNEISTLQDEFISLTDALEVEKKEQNRIIASISHDLKTPLTSVIGYSNLMLEKDMTKEQMSKYNEKINSKAKNMKDILNNFDEYLVNNTSGTLKLKSVKIEDLLDQIKEDYEFDLKNANIKLIIESDCIDSFIKIDVKRIRRIISNIIDNSVRYIKTNGIIKIKVESIKDYYKFIISDNGKGVDENILNKIFDPLFTTDNSRKISGLGLSICKEFVEMHKGTIKAYNNLGLTIEFTIPKEQTKE